MHFDEVPVYRKRPLPQGDLRGRFIVAQSVITDTRQALTAFALAGIRDGGHEGLVFWAGIENESLVAFTTVVVPEANHSAYGVFVNELAYGRATLKAKSSGVVILAQVHSHPGRDARHSDGDDDLIVMPFEGMLSIVIPNYGVEWQSVAQAKVHQLQRGRWTLCSDQSVRRGITTAPSIVDVR